jgi:hypothetical protein
MAIKASSSVTLMMVSDGANGSDGKGILSIVHHYLVTNVTTGVTTNTTGWKTSPSSVTTTNKYLWYYQTINYTTGSPTNTTPAIIGVYGDTGGKGATGKGISSVTPQYYLSTSNTAQSGGSWKTTQDTWSNGKYYWTRDAIAWNDGSTTYTTPTLATGLNNANSTANNAQTIASQTASKFQWIVKSGSSATDFTLTDRTAQLVADSINLKGLVTFKGLDSSTQNKINDANNKIDNLQVGGRNLLRNTAFKDVKKNKEVYVDNKYTKFSNNTLKLICDNTSGTSQKYTIVDDLKSTWDLADVLGQDITISMWIYIETVGQLDGYEFRILFTHNGEYQWFNPNISYPVCIPSASELKVGWNYIYATFSVAEDSTEVKFNFTCNSRPGKKSICWISSPKAEFGNKPTDWTPAPEDKANQSIIDNWAKDATVNGETTINGGYIKTNTIKTDQLAVDDIFATGSAAMNVINAQEINANRITSGQLSAERINAYGLSVLNKDNNQQTFNITNNGEVTIKGSVSSSNYNIGKTGWSINNDGTAEFNDIIARGSVITNDGGIVSSGGSGRNLLKRYIRAGERATKIDDSSITVGVGSIGNTYFYLKPWVKLIKGKTYTISCDASNVPSSAPDWAFGVRVQGSSFVLIINKNGRCYGTGVLDSDVGADAEIIVDDNSNPYSTAPNITLSNFKLEEGDVATDWSPAPEDKLKQVRFWAGTSFEERESAPFIVYSDGSIKATQGEYSGLWTGDIKIGNISIVDPSASSGNDALLTIQNGANGVKRVQLTDNTSSSFAQDVIITNNTYSPMISLKQDGSAYYSKGINIADKTTLNSTSLIINNKTLTTTSNGSGFLFNNELNVGTANQSANLIVHGNTLTDNITVDNTLYFGNVLKFTKNANGINIDFI